MKTELTVNPSGDTITILEGKALEQLQPVKLVKAGNIFAVAAFLAARYGAASGSGLQKVDKETAIVTVNEKDMSIFLQLNPNNAHGTEITASLELSDELKVFAINTQKQFSREQLIKILRFNKRWFTSQDAHSELLKAYQTLSIETAGKINQESDLRGNKSLNYNKTVNSASIPVEFTLTMPIFKGTESKTFRVEICLDATDSSVLFWFESVELDELIKIESKVLIEKQLQSCQDFPIIHQ